MSIVEQDMNVEARALQSQGISCDAIYLMVSQCLKQHRAAGTLLDVGCGTGRLWQFVNNSFGKYLGADVVQYSGFPADGQFVPVDLDSQRVSLPDGEADVVAALETIEHVENPRSFIREIIRLAKPGGLVVVTTPNQLSLLSKLTLLLKNEFNAFRDSSYPADITALLEVDLRRIAAESGLENVEVRYSCQGRLALTPWHYPRLLSCAVPRAFSDNVTLIGRKESC